MDEKPKMGAPSKYKPEFIQLLKDYFDVEPYREVEKKIVTKQGDVIEIPTDVANDFPTLAGFAVSIGIHRETIREWAHEKDEHGNLKHPDFSAAYKMASEVQEHFLITNGLKGLTNPAFSIFAAKNILKWRDNQPGELDRKVEMGGKLEVQSTDVTDRISQLKGTTDAT
jgi:hypothetical protein